MPPGDVPGLNERNIDDGRLLADDPAAQTEPTEVCQAEMPCRYAYLCFHLICVYFVI